MQQLAYVLFLQIKKEVRGKEKLQELGRWFGSVCRHLDPLAGKNARIFQQHFYSVIDFWNRIACQASLGLKHILQDLYLYCSKGLRYYFGSICFLAFILALMCFMCYFLWTQLILLWIVSFLSLSNICTQISLKENREKKMMRCPSDKRERKKKEKITKRENKMP